MYSYSHSGLGQLEDTGFDSGSGIIVIGAIALLTLLLMGTGKELSSFETHPKGRARGKKSKAKTISVHKADTLIDDMRQDVISGLIGQGATKSQAIKAVRASRGHNFDTLFKNSINKIRGLA